MKLSEKLNKEIVCCLPVERAMKPQICILVFHASCEEIQQEKELGKLQ